MKKRTIILFYPKMNRYLKKPSMPNSVLYLERMVRDLDVKTIIINERQNPDYQSIIEHNKKDLFLAGLSVTIGNQIESAVQFSTYIKDNTDAKILWGGWFVNADPDIPIKEPYVDFIIQGQGEIPFRKLVKALLNNENYENINGLGFKINNIPIINDHIGLTDEKLLPRVDYTVIDLDGLFDSDLSKNNRQIDYISSIGCPFKCTFCCLATVYKQRLYHKELNTVIADLKLFINDYSVKSINFNDDYFFGNKKFVIELCNEFIAQKIEFSWIAYAHLSTFLKDYTDEDIKLLKAAGCRSIYFGVESGDTEVLDKTNKKLSIKDVYELSHLLSKNDIIPAVSIIIAFPWDSEKDFNLTLNLLSDLKIKFPSIEVSINFLNPIPKTAIFNECTKQGFKKFKNVNEYKEFYESKISYPWWSRDFRPELEDFVWIYFRFANPNYYKLKQKKVKFIFYVINKLFFPICYLRLKYKYRKCRFDAFLYLKLRNIFNYLTNSKFTSHVPEIMGMFRSNA